MDLRESHSDLIGFGTQASPSQYHDGNKSKAPLKFWSGRSVEIGDFNATNPNVAFVITYLLLAFKVEYDG